MYDILELKKKKLQELQEIAKKLEIDNISNIKKIDLIYQILDKQATSPSDKSRSSEKKQEEVNKDRFFFVFINFFLLFFRASTFITW